MASESREQILGDFMECTGLEDMEECIQFLNQYDWNLLNAVTSVHDRIGGGDSGGGGGGGNHKGNESTVPKNSTTTASHHSTTVKTSSTVKKSNPSSSSSSSNHKRHSNMDDHDDSDDLHIIKSLPGDSRTTKAASVATNRGPVRELHFAVQFKDHTEHITIADNESIHQLRLKIEEKIHISPSRQKFVNAWSTKTYTEQTILKDLHLPKDNELHVIGTATASSTTNGTARPTASTTNSTRTQRHPISPPKTTTATSSSYFPITVLYHEKPNKTIPFELVLKPTTTIGEMKREIEKLTRLPVKQQHWNGLYAAKDHEELCKTSISRKAHLTLRKVESSPSPGTTTATNKRDSKQSTMHRHASEDEPMEIEHDAELEQDDDDIHSDQPHFSTTTTISSTSNRELLIPERCTDETVGLEHFSRVFHARYGATGPILYIGSLDQAIQDSVGAPRNERRPLAIYLHYDRSVCANVFCTQVLASETIVEYLANNYVVWAWDVTSDANRNRLLETFKRCIGHQYAQRINSMDKDAFPLILVLVRSRGTLELISVIEGKSTPSEVMLSLIQAHDVFDQQRQRDVDEEIMRETRENLKKQQEDEYNRSLQADLAKEQARLADERKQQEEQDAQERLQKQRTKLQQECIARLPAEPSETEKNTTRLKIRLPNDEGVLMRRFHISDTLQILFDYLTSQGRMFGEYKLLSAYPKRDLTTLNKSDTLEQLKLYPQEQLILESL